MSTLKVETMKLSVLILTAFLGFLDTQYATFASASFLEHAANDQDGAGDGAGASSSSSVQKRELNTDFKAIWNYVPRTKTTDIAAIDLDLTVIMELLYKEDFVQAQKLYKEGGHVGSTAILELDDVLDQDIAKGASCVIPTGAEDGMGWGSLYVDAKQGDKILFITYSTTANQNDFVGCQVGALPDPKTSGCFVESGTVNFPDLNKNYEYTYKKLEENINLRSLLTLSLSAHNFVENDTFKKYLEYYGSPLYTDEIISAAFDGQNFENSRGDMNFELFGTAGSKEIIEMSIVLLTIWMTVVGSMEHAVSKCYLGTCETGVCQESPGVFEWDSAVAYYAGSALVDPSTSFGNLLFSYADLRCADMKTCGPNGDQERGTALMNTYIFEAFNLGQQDLLEKKCDSAKKRKDIVIDLMAVPLIQGAIRYAHMVQGEMTLGNIERHDAEAAGFAMAVLPLVHACSPVDAETIYNNLKPKSPTAVNFAEVKDAFERNYRCLNVKCHHVGGIYKDSSGSYDVGAEPCRDVMANLTEQQRTWTIVLAVAFGGILIFGTVVCIVNRCEKEPSSDEPKNDDLQLQNDDAEMT